MLLFHSITDELEVEDEDERQHVAGRDVDEDEEDEEDGTAFRVQVFKFGVYVFRLLFLVLLNSFSGLIGGLGFKKF